MRYLTYNVLGWAYEIVKKVRPFKTICIYKSGQKITDHLLCTSFLCNGKKELIKVQWSWNWQVIRFWTMYPFAYLSCVLLYFGPKDLCTFFMKSWHNTTPSVTNFIFLILQTNHKENWEYRERISYFSWVLFHLPSDLILYDFEFVPTDCQKVLDRRTVCLPSL